ncbi:MAG: hypothetical protein H0U16_10985 [Actinobacteria bacterium]|nr:hypothetical protein [Actinomycetota bacterium]
MRQLEGFLLIVGHKEAGEAQPRMDLVEPATKILSHPRVEGTEGLVEQQELGARRQAPLNTPIGVTLSQE